MSRDLSFVVYPNLSNPKDQIPRSTHLGFPKYVLQDTICKGGRRLTADSNYFSMARMNHAAQSCVGDVKPNPKPRPSPPTPNPPEPYL